VYGVHSFSKLGTFLGLFFQAHKLCQSKTFELITTQDAYFLGLLGAGLSVLCGCALEVQAHGVEKDTFLRRRLARFVYGRAHVVRTVSSRLKRVLVESYGVAEEKIVVVPVHVDVTSLGFGTEELAVKTDELRQVNRNKFAICMVGRLVPVKNYPLALRAVARFFQIYPDTHLHIAGEGWLRPSLEKLVVSLGVHEHVTFHRDKRGLELGALYASSDVFMHTADSEGYGMVLIEALHAGLPIVTTDVGCVGDIIRDNENALVVPVGSEDVLLRALTRLRTESMLLDTCKVDAKNSVSTLATFDAVMCVYKTTWQTAIAVHKNSG
jgi:glycosyltransferase involved in cell wall biosynthesis